MVDARRAVAVGYRGAAHRSEDGGETWYEGATATDELRYAVSMADRRHGRAVGQGGAILRTPDGGRRWIGDARVRVLRPPAHDPDPPDAKRG